MDRGKELFKMFSLTIRENLENLNLDTNYLNEIRLRTNMPLILKYSGKEYMLDEKGNMSDKTDKPLLMRQKDIRETMEYIANYSLYAFEEEIKQGFLTIMGGHRVGISGKTIIENGFIKSIKYISSVNIRVSHEIKGCSSKALQYIVNNQEIYNTLIISPPGCGKTTLLRDLIRNISNGWGSIKGRTVGVVDERSEIGSCYMGIPQNDVGIRTDVLDCCPKNEGMLMLIRSMAPEVLAIDEIGGKREIDSIRYAMNCGCKMIATVHGNSYQEIVKKNENIFERYIILDKSKGTGTISTVYDNKGERKL